jgi:hypothetical protein
MADAMGEVCEPRSGVERAALSTLPVACLIHAGSISAQVYQDEKPTEGKKANLRMSESVNWRRMSESVNQ